jgi:hypothetical protein
MCRRADHTGVSATAHIGRGVLFRSSPKAHHRTGQVAWRSAVPYPGCLDGGRANPRIGRSAPRRGRCLLHHARQHQSSRRRRVDRSSPPGPHLEDAALSCRGPCRAGKTPSQSPADKRRQHLSEAPERVRHVTAPSRGRALSKPAGAQGSKLRGSVALHWLLPAAPHIPPEAPTSDPTARDGLILPDPRSLGLRHR